MSTVTVADVEWVLQRNEWVVHDFRGMLVIPFESGTNVYASVVTLAGVPFVVLRAIVGSDLQPSPALYRWVATQAGESVVGGLDADVTEDGTVSVHLQYFVPMVGFDDDTVDVIIGSFSARADELVDTARQMFA